MPASLLNVPHYPQVDEAGCLLAGVEMVTTYLGKRQLQPDLAKLLESMPEGVPASRIKRLEKYDFRVVYGADATIGVLEAALVRGLPPIIILRTVALEYWDVVTDHATVLVGLDNAQVFMNDPAFDDAPKVCSRAAFELAWSELENRYAVISL